MRYIGNVIKRSLIFGSETRNVTGDRHSQVPLEHCDMFVGYLEQGLRGWIEHHASDSEAIVKAEKHAIEQTLAQLQIASTTYFSPSTTSANSAKKQSVMTKVLIST